MRPGIIRASSWRTIGRRAYIVVKVSWNKLCSLRSGSLRSVRTSKNIVVVVTVVRTSKIIVVIVTVVRTSKILVVTVPNTSLRF